MESTPSLSRSRPGRAETLAPARGERRRPANGNSRAITHWTTICGDKQPQEKRFDMWWTPDGKRILQGGEGRLFREALAMILDAVGDGNEGLRQFAAPPFNRLQPYQKLAVSDFLAPPPKPLWRSSVAVVVRSCTLPAVEHCSPAGTRSCEPRRPGDRLASWFALGGFREQGFGQGAFSLHKSTASILCRLDEVSWPVYS